MKNFINHSKSIALLILSIITALSCKQSEVPKDKLAVLKNVAIQVVETDINEPITEATKIKLKEMLDSVEILGLGENTHEDGATFSAKVKLIKFLHEEMGFNVLAFEDAFYGCWLTNEAYKKISEDAYNTSCYIWANNEESHPIYEYIIETHKTDNPLYIAGFDGEKIPNGIKDIKIFYKELKMLTDIQFPENTEVQIDSLFSGVFTGFAGWETYKALSRNSRANAIKALDSLRTTFELKKETIIKQIGSEKYKSYALVIQTIFFEENEIRSPALWNMRRDKSMGKRVEWIKEEMYPKEKIILWAASGHLMRNSVMIDRKDSPYPFEPFYQLGDYVYSTYGDKYYNLIFTSSQGERGSVFPEGHRSKQYESLRAVNDEIVQGSFEDISKNVGYEEFIVDLRSQTPISWLSGTYTAHPFGYNNDTAPWSKVIDGFYFIKTMKPVHFK